MGITSGSLSKLVFFSYLFSLKEKITNIRECEWKGDKFQGLVNDFKLVTWKKKKKNTNRPNFKMIFIIIFRPLCYYKELGGWRAVKPLSQNELELLYMESKNVG